jgi:hypothetical protein
MNKEFEAELQDLLNKWDCYIRVDPLNKANVEVVPVKPDAWAVVNSKGLYLCNQGRAYWYQISCDGWAVRSADRGWVVQHTSNRRDVGVVPMVVVGGVWKRV